MTRFPLLLAASILVAAASWAQEGPRDLAPATTTADAGRALSLPEALQLAEQAGEGVRVAEAAVARAEAQKRQARSERFPQLDASAAIAHLLRVSSRTSASTSRRGESRTSRSCRSGSATISTRPGGETEPWSGGRITALTAPPRPG